MFFFDVLCVCLRMLFISQIYFSPVVVQRRVSFSPLRPPFSVVLSLACANANALFPFLYAVVLENEFDKKKMTNEEERECEKEKKPYGAETQFSSIE